MGFRTVYGHDHSEDGWPMVDEGSCQWITVPGTNPSVSLQIQKGQPLAILRAWAADFHAFVEPLRDADSACWTPTNSVATSNHLSGSACDLNWGSHPFRVLNAGFTSSQINTIRDMLKYYEGTVFWGNDWDNPKDAMHFQVGYDTFNNSHTQDFINRKIRPDGYSTFRRGDAPAVDLAKVLSNAMGGSLSLDRYRQLLPAVQQALKACGCNNLNRVAMWMAQLGHESGGLQWMEEIADGSKYEGRTDLGNTQPGDGRKFKGRGPIQVTGRHNYGQLSNWAFSQKLVPSPTYFVDNPAELSSDRYGFIGVVWYWTVARPQINSLCDAGDLVGVTKAINGGTNGLDDRRSRWNHCLDMGDSLLQLTSAATTPTPTPIPTPIPTPQEDDFMSALSPEEQRSLYNEIMSRHPSRSPLRRLGEGDIGDMVDTEYAIDGNVHVLVVELLARLGSPSQLALLNSIANADPVLYPDRQDDATLAATILDRIYSNDPVLATNPTVTVAPQTAQVAPIVVAAKPIPTTTGQLLGQAYDALEALRLGQDLPNEAKAPLDALITVLKSYPKETS